MQFWDSIKPYLLFSKKEKRGVIVLLILLIIVLGLRILLPYIYNNRNSSKIEFGLIELEAKEKARVYEERKFKKNKIEQDRIQKQELVIEPAFFDPNTESYEQLIKIGFSQRIAGNIIKYREAGGIIKNNTDIYKIYGVDSSYVNLVDNYCKIAPKYQEQVSFQSKSIEEKLSVDINEADSARLVLLPGVGEVLSKRIIRYRKLLGGFVKKQQLLEVYGIKEDTYNLIEPHITLDTNNVIFININEADQKQLSCHPYISSYQAKAIMKYKELVGNFSIKTELLDNYIFTNEEYNKVKFYLQVK